MQNLMLDIVNNFGYWGIFLLILIETIFPPIPSEAVLLFGGALTVTTGMNIPGTILAATVGSVTGAVLLYALGRIFRAERLKKIFDGKFGRALHLKPEYVDTSLEWFEKYENKAVLLCRCVPLIRSFISIPAGCAMMKIPQFLLLTVIGSAVWNTVLVFTGAALGTAWESAMPYFDKYTHAAMIGIIILFAVGVLYYLLKRKKRA